MLDTYWKGIISEYFARVYLRCKGYRILEKRFKCYKGEIDLIACRKNTLIAVEVKYRLTERDALESISDKQKKRILDALNCWMYNKKYLGDVRIDAIIFYKYGIKHLKNCSFYKEN